jgi:hypothetical protein
MTHIQGLSKKTFNINLKYFVDLTFIVRGTEPKTTEVTPRADVAESQTIAQTSDPQEEG